MFEKVKFESSKNENEEALLKKYRDAEFDLTVEYQLGSDFSPERWKVLRVVYEHVQNSTIKLKEQYLSGDLQKSEFLDLMKITISEMTKRFAEILTPDEMIVFLGQESGINNLISFDEFI